MSAWGVTFMSKLCLVLRQREAQPAQNYKFYP